MTESRPLDRVQVIAAIEHIQRLTRQVADRIANSPEGCTADSTLVSVLRAGADVMDLQIGLMLRQIASYAKQAEAPAGTGAWRDR